MMTTTPPITPTAIAIVCCVVIALPVTAASLLDNPAPLVCDSNGELVDRLPPDVNNTASPVGVVDVLGFSDWLVGDCIVVVLLSVCPSELGTWSLDWLGDVDVVGEGSVTLGSEVEVLSVAVVANDVGMTFPPTAGFGLSETAGKFVVVVVLEVGSGIPSASVWSPAAGASLLGGA